MISIFEAIEDCEATKLRRFLSIIKHRVLRKCTKSNTRPTIPDVVTDLFSKSDNPADKRSQVYCFGFPMCKSLNESIHLVPGKKFSASRKFGGVFPRCYLCCSCHWSSCPILWNQALFLVILGLTSLFSLSMIYKVSIKL
jgi:hypothetical protein